MTISTPQEDGKGMVAGGEDAFNRAELTVSGVKKYPPIRLAKENKNINQKLKCHPRRGFSATKPPTIGPTTDR